MLFIHIGMPKTGTTTLQRILSNNKNKLSRRNFIYPALWRDDENIAHHGIGKALKSYDKNTTTELTDFLRYHRDKDIILSTESFSNLLTYNDYPFFYNFLITCSQIMPVKIICALRRIDSFIESMCLHDSKIFGWRYLQGVSQPSRENVIGEYIKRRFNWIEIFFSKLRQLDLSTEACSLVTIPLEDDIVRTILKLIGIEGIIDNDVKLLRENAHLGFKAQCFFAHFDDFAACMKNKITSKGELINKFESRQFEFSNEIYNYHIFDFYQRLCLHEFALHKSLQYNLMVYYNTYSHDEIPQWQVNNIMNTDIITGADLAKLSRYIGLS